MRRAQSRALVSMPDTSADMESVRRVVLAAGWRRVGIDGIDAVGKSQLAERLSRSLQCPILDVDDYLYKNQGGYVDFIDYPALSHALSTVPAFILCGVCLREVLANLGAKLDAHIYVKRMSHGQWKDEYECVFPDGVDAAIENLAWDAAVVSNLFDERSDRRGHEIEEAPRLSDEIMRYHDKWQPQEVADLLFERADDAG
jgi:hypothetical protein